MLDFYIQSTAYKSLRNLFDEVCEFTARAVFVLVFCDDSEGGSILES